MKTAVTMLGEAFRQWQKDWDNYDKGIGVKPPSYEEFIKLSIEKEREQIIEAWIATDNQLQRLAAEEYYNQTYNQNELPKTYINGVEVDSDNSSVTTTGVWTPKTN
jgi:hypothetical protein